MFYILLDLNLKESMQNNVFDLFVVRYLIFPLWGFVEFVSQNQSAIHHNVCCVLLLVYTSM